jgi:hypothetical protein
VDTTRKRSRTVIPPLGTVTEDELTVLEPRELEITTLRPGDVAVANNERTYGLRPTRLPRRTGLSGLYNRLSKKPGRSWEEFAENEGIYIPGRTWKQAAKNALYHRLLLGRKFAPARENASATPRKGTSRWRRALNFGKSLFTRKKTRRQSRRPYQ